MELIDIVVALLTLIAVFIPLIISRIEKRDKLKKTIYLIELIKTKDELINLINRYDENKSSPILFNKLNNNLEEINQEIYKSKKRFRIIGFFTFISLEILILFYIMSRFIIGKSKLGFLEGFLKSELSNVLLLFLIFAFSFFVTFKFINTLKNKIKNPIIFNFTIIIFYNLILFLTLSFIYFFLAFTDKLTNLW
jgi:hypothetical protein|tara:strand:- start:99 stop:680 length:582 start_codon:yes stop_codon:yes gene_type:complete